LERHDLVVVRTLRLQFLEPLTDRSHGALRMAEDDIGAVSFARKPPHVLPGTRCYASFRKRTNTRLGRRRHHMALSRCMNRRALLAIAGAAAICPLIALGQTQRRVYRVAFVGPQNDQLTEPFRARLAELGYVEGKNLEFRYFPVPDGNPDDLSTVTRKALAWKPDVIRASWTPNVRRIAALTATVPIVFNGVSDPVASGLVTSLARPGVNVTGVSIVQTELTSKRLELVRELLPRAKRVALIVDSKMRPASAMNEILLSAHRLGLSVEEFDPSREPRHYIGALERIAKARPDAVIHVFATPDARDVALGARQPVNPIDLLYDLQRVYRIPVVWTETEGVERGLLAGLGGTWQEQAQITADQTAAIFRGTPIGEVPIQRLTRISVAINLRAAKELGITVPDSALNSADKVID
jgi:putative tryptophan/tyrosine transport system substrate-binding protein